MGDIPTEDMVSKEFLEEAIGKKIASYKITSGTKPGDNFSSILFSLEVNFPTKDSRDDTRGNDKEKAYLIVKCYPANPARQEFLVQCNLFWKEMSFYQTYLPKLIQMQKDMNMTEIIQPAFPAVISAQTTDFYKVPVTPGKVYAPFDHFIMMVDIRKTYGFKMYDRLKSLDKDHVSLVMKSMATIHALSWVYKQKNNLEKLTDHFPFMKTGYSRKSLMEPLEGVVVIFAKQASDTVELVLGKDSPAAKGTKNFVSIIKDVINIQYGASENKSKEFEKYLRVKPEIFEDEKPWNIGVLGDVWSNNMLFRYNEATGIPEEVIHVDLQVCGESCPTSDLVYLIYASTDSKFRKMHLDDMLYLYVEKFKSVCQQFEVDPLPNFTQSEFKRRFHRAKVCGYASAVLIFPGSMTDPENAVDMEAKEQDNIDDMFASFVDNKNKVSRNYMERIVELAKDLYEDGII